MRREEGFTLVELAIAVLIMIVIMMLAVPSMNGVLADRRLRRSLDEFNSMVRQAQERSMAEGRPYLLIWRNGKVGLRAESLARGEDTGPAVLWNLGKKESFKVVFPAALLDETPAEWIFWPSGNCEPAVVKYQGPDGSWTASYSALTARAEMVTYAAK